MESGDLISMKGFEIPVNLTLRDIKEGEWATARLHIDTKDESGTTAEALKKHFGGKFQMTNKPDYVTGKPSHNFVVSKDFVYQVFWQVK